MGNTTNSLADKSRLRQMIDSYGVPRMIITGFLLLMFVLVPFAGVDFATQISNVIGIFLNGRTRKRFPRRSRPSKV